MSKQIKKLEYEMMEELWMERPHICEITGRPIRNYSIWNFHHILSKQSYPEGRLDKANILICLPEIHQEIHDFKSREKKKFEWVYKYAEVLKIKYNHQKNYNTWL